MRVAVVHDYLTQRGGAERVVLSILRTFPGSRLYTSFYQPDTTFQEFRDHDVRTMPLNRLAPLRKDPRRALPLLAPAFSRLRLDDVDAVVASSSGWAHGVHADAAKIVYCHNPARWLYQDEDYLPGLPGAARPAYELLSSPLRSWDRRRAASADLYLANSSVVAERVQRIYGRTAEILHPPPGLQPVGPQDPVPGLAPGFMLTVARARTYKNTELVCEAVEGMPGVSLVVVGGLPHGRAWSDRLRGLTGVSDAQLRWLYANCAGLVAVGHEDFGLSPVEAYSMGRPATVLAAGGYLDSADTAHSSVLIEAQTPDAVRRGIQTLLDRTWDSEKVRAHADDFAESRFSERLRDHVERAVARRAAAAADRPAPKVVFLDQGARATGGELALARLLRATGDRVDAHVILGEDGPLVPVLREAGATVEVLPLVVPRRTRSGPAPRPTTGLRGTYATLLYVRLLARRLRDLEPDLVHTNSLAAHLYGGLAARLVGVPVLWHVRDRVAVDHLPPSSVRLVRIAARLLPGAVVAPSRSALETVLRDGARTPWHVVPDPFEPTRALHVLDDRRGPLRVGMVGSPSAGKGQDVFLRALAQLDATADGAVTAVVVGSVGTREDHAERDLRDLAARLGLVGRVEFLDHVVDVAPVLARLDVLVSCSVLPGSSEQLVVAGMAAGLAVVVSADGGPAEFLQEGVDGLVVPPLRPDLLAAALTRLIEDDVLRGSLGRAAERSARRFLPAAVAPQVLRAYDELRGLEHHATPAVGGPRALAADRPPAA